MTTATQQLPANPALDFANAVLAETDGGREIVFMLHDIAQGVRENATTNDRINASNILIDGGLGKCPKKAPATTSPNPNPSNDKPKAKKQPKSPRLVTQLGDSLHRSFGPPPEAHPGPAQTEDTSHTVTQDENPGISRTFRPLLYPASHSRNHQQLPDSHDRPDRHLPRTR